MADFKGSHFRGYLFSPTKRPRNGRQKGPTTAEDLSDSASAAISAEGTSSLDAEAWLERRAELGLGEARCVKEMVKWQQGK